MEFKDLIIAPFVAIVLTLIAYFLRPYLTNKLTKKYFLPALWARFAGAVFLGVIYQFYYSGGDTYNFFDQSTVIWEAFQADPPIALKLIFFPDINDPEIFQYSSRIYWFRASSEFMVIRIIGFLSLITFNSYTAIALFFAFFSFGGSWMMFRAIQTKYSEITKILAITALFIPSCIFWGTGILKDTLTIGALGYLFWALDKLIERRRFSPVAIGIIVFASWIIYSVKIYILLCFIPSVFIWWYLKNVGSIKNTILKITLVPIFMIIFIGGGYYVLKEIASTSERYNLDSVAEWSYITSYDIRYYTGKGAGSGYDLGAQDGSWQTLLRMAPAAINVSLFRPYLWEVRNPLMLLSALEAIVILVLSIRLFFKFQSRTVRLKLRDPMIAMMIIFSISFAFAVGVSTYNFGSLSRYKIPLLPFYATAVVILSKWTQISKQRKLLRRA